MAAHRLIAFSKKEYEFLEVWIPAKLEGTRSQGGVDKDIAISIEKKFSK